MLEVVKFDAGFLDLSYNWLQNDKELKWLTVTGDFTKEEQLKWHIRLTGRKDYKIYGILINKKPAGAFGIKNISSDNGEYWGYIALREYWGKGFGTLILDKAFEKAKKMHLKYLYLFVRNLDNKRAINLYIKYGFKIIESGDNYLKMQKFLT